MATFLEQADSHAQSRELAASRLALQGALACKGSLMQRPAVIRLVKQDSIDGDSQ